MKNLTTPKAILFGLGLIALAIASVPYSSQIIKPAFAFSKVQKVAICGFHCRHLICCRGYQYIRRQVGWLSCGGRQNGRQFVPVDTKTVSLKLLVLLVMICDWCLWHEQT